MQTTQPVVVWLADKKRGTTYRCMIDGQEYIRSRRKSQFRKRKPRILTTQQRQKRRQYMKTYRIRQLARIRNLEAKLDLPE